MPRRPVAGRPSIVWLDDERACDVDLAGAKAANLARASAHGLPVLPGFVLTTAATERAPDQVAVDEPLHEAWAALTAAGDVALVVRSSSTIEDATTSSMAGQFTSLLDVRGWEAFREAVSTVLASADRPRDAVTRSRPMAVLVQPLLSTRCGGVLFGLDPVTGNRRHLIVEAVPGPPDVLVSGTATAAHVVLGRRGRTVGGLAPKDRALLPPRRRRRLARLAQSAADAFDGPQDVEWAFDQDDRLWLLQSRSVTACGPGAEAAGRVLGPGPVAETFPDPLRRLEEALWVDPLRAGVIGALRVTGAVGPRRLASSPVVTTVGGWVAVDLELFGIVPHRSRWRRVNPLPGARRLFAAWRVGRLRSALPGLARDLMAMLDADLQAVGDLTHLDDRSLVELLDRADGELTALHGHEVLAGILLRGGGDRSGVAAAALDALGRGRADGLTDGEIISREPVVLALLPPTLGPRAPLPASPRPLATEPSAGPTTVGGLGCREALRLRCRWVQELGARIALELGHRLTDRGVLERADLVRELSIEELWVALEEQRGPADLLDRASTPAGPPLPMAFRLAGPSTPVPLAPAERGGDGLPASAGRATGIVCHDPAAIPADGSGVLVVDVLDPRLAWVLPELAALVSESGSTLSHLAILAREVRLPTVVAVADARMRFPAGSRVLVDGDTGDVRALREAATTEAGPTC